MENEKIGLESSRELKDEDKLSRKRRHSFISRFGCMNLNDDVPVTANPDASGRIDVVASGDGNDASPSHLIVMVNGLMGRARNWRYAAKRFVEAFAGDAIVHCSESNSLTLTFDGVDVMGRRLADEVISVIGRHPNLQKISFIGHSLGGLITRYAIAVLYQQDLSADDSEINGECGDKLKKPSIEMKTSAKIAGLEPINFITSATPHLGSRGHKQVPMFCGLHAMEKAALHVSWLLGRTGKHLFLRDSDDGKPPLLLQMSNDCEDLKFISALQSFKRCIAYANARFDYIVGWSSSSLRQTDELPKRRDLVKEDKYRHIFKEETTKTMPSEGKIAKGKMEEAMLTGLTKASWERVDVNFQGSIQSIVAHWTIQVKTYRINYHGANVIQHMIDNFVL